MISSKTIGYSLLVLAGIIFTSFIGAMIKAETLPFIWFAWIIVIAVLLIKKD